MEYQFSKIVDPSLFDSKGLIADIPVRKNLFSEAEYFKGALDPKYPLMSVDIPECRPERLEIVAYANEFAFLYDDATEYMAHDQVIVSMNESIRLFLEAAETGHMNPQGSGINNMQAQMFKEMATIDQPRTMVAMKAWAEFLQLTSSRYRRRRFETLDEYIPYRVWDVGQMHMFGLITFGMGLTIPESDMEKCTKDT
ncbi:hypothetical protein K458DRAFT_394093 [Lentithecium fluviatile CBS 122367]|uniref:Terpenoid synthase n=1 Tax=Lentithecium fluviatile CBS 122367 TaxID=1168545 RepID=A0A6G1IM68_9PLEO|nr:hypothetical protein K458DRAFT_394093 [Lentithecium fluviatile CBS 122367]